MRSGPLRKLSNFSIQQADKPLKKSFSEPRSLKISVEATAGPLETHLITRSQKFILRTTLKRGLVFQPLRYPKRLENGPMDAVP